MIPFVGHEYLLSRNFTLNGGLISRTLSSIKFVNNSNKVTVEIGNINIFTYIIDFFFKSTKLVQKFDPNTGLIDNYETISNINLVTTYCGLTYIIVPFLFGLLLSIFWIIWQAIHDHPRIQSWRHNIYKLRSKNSENGTHHAGKISFFSEEEFQKKKKYFLTKNLIISSICGALAIAFIISFAFSAISQISVQNQLVNTNTNDSVISSLKQTSGNLDSFFNLILVDSYRMFNNSLETMHFSMQNLLQASLNNLKSQLMSSFGVTALFETLGNLLSNLNVTVNSMDDVVLNRRAILSDIDNLKGKFSVYKSQIQSYIQSVCNKQSDTQCQQILNDSNLLYVPIITSNINTESSVNMIFVLQNFHLNLSQLATQVQNLQLKFNDDIQAITNVKIKELNLQQSINNIRGLWNDISSFILPIKNNFPQTSNTISEYFKIGSSIYIVISTLIFVFVSFIFCFYSFSILRYAIIYYFERIILIDRMTAPSTRPIFVLHHFKKERIIKQLQKDYNNPRWTIYTYLIIFRLILLLLIVVSIASIFVGEIIYNETCAQLWNPIGLENTDKIINDFLTIQWNSISAYIKAILNLPISITKPNKILQSIQSKCINETGLFSVLQWTEMVNISSFVWSTSNMNTLRSGLNMTYDMLIRINTKNLMPPDMSSFLNMASNITRYFDEIDYTTSINELSKGIIALNNISAWLNNSIKYFSTIKTQESSLVIQNLVAIQQNLPTINNLQIKVNQFRNNYIQIQQTRKNNHLINQLLTRSASIQSNFVPSPSTYNTVATEYSTIMLSNFTVETDAILTKEVRLLMDKLFPCRNLSEAFRILLNTMCNTNQLLESFVNNGFMLIILSVLLELIFYFHWILICTDYSDNAENNISRC